MRSILLFLTLAISGIVAAHSCCYSYWYHSEGWEPSLYPADCIHWRIVTYEWEELWPTSNAPDHDHFWIGGTFTKTYGPYPIYNCP